MEINSNNDNKKQLINNPKSRSAFLNSLIDVNYNTEKEKLRLSKLPSKGPKFLNKANLMHSGNTLTGNIEPYSIDNFSFDEQHHTFTNFGYASDPTPGTKKKFLGNESNYKELGGSTIYKKNLLKKRIRKKPKRETYGDPSDIDGYKGPWARFDDEKELKKDFEEKQKRIKELYEESKKKEKEKLGLKVKKGQKGKEIETKDLKEKNEEKSNEGQNLEEKSVFEYVEEFDYQGRTYMHCPKEFRPKETGPSRCYIPTKIVHTWRGHSAPITLIRFFPKTGHLILSSSIDKTIKIWDVNGHRRCLRTFYGHTKGVIDISFNKNGTRFLSVGHDQWIKIWDTETGKAISRFTSGAGSKCARFYPLDENEFLSAQKNKLVVGWDIRSGEIVQKYDEHLKAVNSLAFIDNNRKFVSSSDDKKILVWEYGIPVVLNHISEPYMSSVTYLTESPDQGWFLGQSMDNTITAYSSADMVKRKKREYKGHFSEGYSCQVDVSPDNQFIVSGDGNGRLFFWDWKTRRIFKTLKAHKKVATGAIWHPVHQSKVASASWDGTIKFWD